MEVQYLSLAVNAISQAFLFPTIGFYRNKRPSYPYFEIYFICGHRANGIRVYRKVRSKED